MKKTQSEPGWSVIIGALSREVFRASFATYFLFLILEEVREGFVTFHFPMGVLLFVVLVSGFLSFLLARQEERHAGTFAFRGSAIVVASGLAAVMALVLYTQTKTMGAIGLLISVLAGVAVLLLAAAVAEENGASADAPESRAEKEDPG